MSGRGARGEVIKILMFLLRLGLVDELEIRKMKIFIFLLRLVLVKELETTR